MRIRYGFYALATAALAVTSASAQTPAAITVTSATLKANDVIPKDHTADGRNVSPTLMWSGAQPATKQVAMIMDDPDAQFGGQNFVHWVVYKIPAAAKGLPAELPMEATLTAPADLAGTIQGLSGFRRAGYRGPAPPAGKPHHYTFTVYALDVGKIAGASEKTTGASLVFMMRGHMLAQGSISGRFGTD